MSGSSERKAAVFPEWSGDPLPPRDFLKTHPLPQVARLHEGETSVPSPSPSRLDLRQPLLLYKSYSSVKVHARSLNKDARGKWKEVGPTVVVPEDYTGWFSIVTDNGRTASYLTSVEQVAQAHVPYFLVRHEVSAYKVSDPRLIPGKTTYTKTTIKTGHVLKLLGVYEDVNSRHYKNLNRHHKNNSANCAKYAQCVNYKGEVLFLSFAVQGKFYATATRDARSVNHVYLMSHLLRTIKFPVTVRLVCGFLPKIPCSFTGTLRLQSARREDIILACTLLKERNVMLEMDANSDFSLSRALHEDTYAKNDVYRGAMAFCADEADIWRRQMKVVHHVYPDLDTTSGSNDSRGQRSSRLLLHNNNNNNNLNFNINNNTSETTRTQSSGSGSGSGTGSSGSRKPLLKAPSTPTIGIGISKSKRKVSPTPKGVESQPPVCVAMIFDETDAAGSAAGEGTPAQAPTPPTKFWTLRRLKQLVQNDTQSEAPYAVVKPKEAIYEVVDDGSENANAEFTAQVPAVATVDTKWLPKGPSSDIKWLPKGPSSDIKWVPKIPPPYELPENGTYVMSQKNKDSIYDSIC